MGEKQPRGDAKARVPKKGDCPACGEGVYADQPRAHENGAYYHEACLAAGAPGGSKMSGSRERATPQADRTISIVKTPRAEPARPKKGDCPTCGEGVYADQPRAHENGAYYHEACLAVGATPDTMARTDGQGRAKVSALKAPKEEGSFAQDRNLHVGSVGTVESMLARLAEEQAAAVRAEALVALKKSAGAQMSNEEEQKQEEARRALEAVEREQAEVVLTAKQTAEDQLRQMEEFKRAIQQRITNQRAKAQAHPVQTLAEKASPPHNEKKIEEEMSLKKAESVLMLARGQDDKTQPVDSALKLAHDKLAAIQLTGTRSLSVDARSPSVNANSIEDSTGVNGDQNARKAADRVEEKYLAEMLRVQVDSVFICGR